MKLSIITVNLNNHEGLIETFGSISAQTFQDFEYIVIDGLSEDGSQKEILSNQRIDQFLCEKDSGVYDAMNKGINIANGEYILFLNSGDSLSKPSTLRNVINELADFDIIYGDLLFADKLEPYVFNYPPKLCFEFLHKASLAHPATFIKKTLFDKFGFYDQTYRIVADWVFFMKVIVKENVTTKHISHVVANFDTKGMSSTTANMQQILLERENYLKKEFPLFLEDYKRSFEVENELKRIKSAKGYRWLRALGVKKFQ